MSYCAGVCLLRRCLLAEAGGPKPWPNDPRRWLVGLAAWHWPLATGLAGQTTRVARTRGVESPCPWVARLGISPWRPCSALSSLS
jgi:hypothetical protein